MKLLKKSHQQGFTLLEISIALLLVGILLGGALTINSASRQVDKADETKAQMNAIKNGLLSYLKVNKYLPCPDIDNDGVEDRKISGGVSVCKSRNGTLPYQTLVLPEVDAWGNPFYYRVNARAELSGDVNDLCETASVFGLSGTRTKPSTAALCTQNGVFYCDKCSDVCGMGCDYNADPRTVDAPPYFSWHTPPKGAENPDGYKNMLVEDESGNEYENAVVAMVVSFGSNGAQTWTDCDQATLANSVERANCDNDAAGVFKVDTAVTMDDYLTWITIFDVKSAMLDVRGF